ncbi:MAG: hypothetical protein AVDCRST_MAG01-01-493 [uncultured Rubrobacteraceae bacterium]|uniref:Uncharacterized protein n=1 Tax=uncultured Rubrobacteraceae bacterium TaxID=349277 RepID=A0A6J4NQ50_9ACTN|nr:MAG: hypothetical protein AVDCRST_MAG01-01-493 [uncultured Rubrobacteraceae bacterium]
MRGGVTAAFVEIATRGDLPRRKPEPPTRPGARIPQAAERVLSSSHHTPG